MSKWKKSAHEYEVPSEEWTAFVEHAASICKKHETDFMTTIVRQDEEIEELKAVLVAIASAPYPLHDHCTEEQWELACNLYQESLKDEK